MIIDEWLDTEHKICEHKANKKQNIAKFSDKIVLDFTLGKKAKSDLRGIELYDFEILF